MLLFWFGVLFWLQGASIWFAALRVLGMRQRAVPGLSQKAQQYLMPKQEKLLAYFISQLGPPGQECLWCPVIHQQLSFEWKEDLAGEMMLGEGEDV